MLFRSFLQGEFAEIPLSASLMFNPPAANPPIVSFQTALRNVFVKTWPGVWNIDTPEVNVKRFQQTFPIIRFKSKMLFQPSVNSLIG